MWVTRLDRARDFVNEAYAEFACGPGCGIEEARSLDWRSRIHPDDVDQIIAESIAGEASLKLLRSRVATGGGMTSIAGCGPCRSPASARTASWSVSSA